MNEHDDFKYIVSSTGQDQQMKECLDFHNAFKVLFIIDGKYLRH
jgi:hypothetical protein